jgi:hypothetical protein
VKRGPFSHSCASAFDTVQQLGLALAGVEAVTKYDGSPVLKLGGSFVAGLATHHSAEPDSIVVRVGLEDRAWLLEDAPETYYLTDYYRPYPIVLVRLSRVDRDALRDLLSASCRLAAEKVRGRGRFQRRAAGSSATAVRTRS